MPVKLVHRDADAAVVLEGTIWTAEGVPVIVFLVALEAARERGLELTARSAAVPELCLHIVVVALVLAQSLVILERIWTVVA